ncbi:hypothetical protein AB834_00085 [PVC group bacterium (ex Bugula neritina AB1)]|nr:hypothetical protein AB834_00085 [PVC group bacterium (ex Bugula neritina AB1)]
MIILVGSQKGGCGKTTLASNISVELNRNSNLVLLDADRQASCSYWIETRDVSDLKRIQSFQKHGDVRKSIQDLNSKYDHVVIDTAGHDSKELRTALLVSDLFLAPFRTSQHDINTLPTIQNLVSMAKDFNPNLLSCAILTMVETNPRIDEEKNARKAFKAFPELKLLNSKIGDRKVYRDATIEGMGVTEMKDVKAKNEIIELIKEIIDLKKGV